MAGSIMAGWKAPAARLERLGTAGAACAWLESLGHGWSRLGTARAAWAGRRGTSGGEAHVRARRGGDAPPPARAAPARAASPGCGPPALAGRRARADPAGCPRL